jgi:hypothetical protein
MNRKRACLDILVVAGALAVLVITTLLLPSFWQLWLRALIGALFASLLFAIYLVARPPDQVIALQRQVESIALNASKVKQAAGKLIPGARAFQQDLLEIATAIAQLAVKILRRELLPQETEIRRLESLSQSFLTLTRVLTGEVYLRPEQQQQKISEMRSEHIPDTRQTLQELNVALDESRAKELASAEQELELLATLYDQNTAAHHAAQILQNVLAETPNPASGGPDVP